MIEKIYLIKFIFHVCSEFTFFNFLNFFFSKQGFEKVKCLDAFGCASESNQNLQACVDFSGPGGDLGVNTPSLTKIILNFLGVF